MSGLTSSVGLITGVPIQDTVDQLIAISALPRDRLVNQTAGLSQRQVAITDLTAAVIGVQLSAQSLAKPAVFADFDVNSSNPSLVSVSKTGTPTPGSFTFQPYRLAGNQQFLGDAVSSDTDPLGAGSLTVGFGGFVNESVGLDQLNGGNGVQRGVIRITDRSGNSADIDLRYAKTIDDVLTAINTNATVNVTATTDGDRLQLTDNTGQSVSNLIVQQVGAASTAADLGIDGINVAASSASGNDIVSLAQTTLLNSLNNGNGVAIKKSVAELEVSFRDGSTNLQIDFTDETTIGEILDTINAADPARLQASLSSDGNRIQLTDLTNDTGGTFAVTSLFGGSVAQDLGLDATAVGGSISGNRIQAGLKTSLLSRLNGGQGLGTLGQLNITDRSGTSTTVDLSAAESLDDVINLINANGVAKVTAAYNTARNGIELTDSSLGAGNLTIANGVDGLETADKLNVAIDAATSSVNSGTLGRQSISANTTLASLNNGLGVDASSFLIYDTNGSAGGVNIATEGLTTVGDVIDSINALGIGVNARISDSGDGIVLVDTAGGSQTLTVQEAGNGNAAADLGILGTSETVDIGGTPTQVIDGSFTQTITIDADDNLDDLVETINGLNAGFTASKFFDGTSYRLALSSDVNGKAGELLVDTTDAGFSLNEIAAAQDALIVVGDASALGAGVLVSSSTNTFKNVIPGVEFTLQQASTESVTITVNETTNNVVSTLKLFVDAYNKVIDKLDEYTSFENGGSETDPSITTGILFGTSEVLRVEQALSDLASGRVFGAGKIRSLAEIGIDVGDDGKLSFDEEKFAARYSQDPQDVEDFFTTEDTGVFNRFNAAIERLAGVDNSVLINGNQTLQNKIDSNQQRIDRLNELLDLERERLLKEFFTLEQTIQNIQSATAALANIVALPPITSTGSNTGF